MTAQGDRIGPGALPLPTRALYALSQVAAHLALPLLLVALVLRARKEPAHLRHLSHRLGLGPVGAPGAVWVYAASLGETRAASPLIRRLRAAGRAVILSHQSPAGLEEGHRLFPDDPGITHRYAPADLFWAVRLFLARARPAALSCWRSSSGPPCWSRPPAAACPSSWPTATCWNARSAAAGA